MNVVKELATHILTAFEAFEGKFKNLESGFAGRIEKLKAEIIAELTSGATEAVEAVGAKVAAMKDGAKAEEPEAPARAPEPATTSPVLVAEPNITAANTTATTSDGATTTLDHATGEVTATASDGSTITPHPVVVEAVNEAAATAGVSVGG